MTLDIAMGGSTNTCCTCSPPRRRPRSISPWPTSTGCRARAATVQGRAGRHPDVHIEDVHRAGGIMAILGELDARPAAHRCLPTVHAADAGRCARRVGHRARTTEAVQTFFKAAPGGVPTQVAFSQSPRAGRAGHGSREGVIRSIEHAFTKDGGLAVLYGNIAREGCIVKTAGVDESVLEVQGPSRASSRARTRRWTASSAASAGRRRGGDPL
jgi:dihydroxy-acid dehydratase